jgi:hypothetical protein
MKMAKERVSLREKAKEKSKKMGKRSYGYLNLPDGANLFKVEKEGVKRINIIPFIAGSKNPSTKEGDYDYEVTFFTHNGLGDSGMDKVICPKATWGRPCPICEYIATLMKDYKSNKDEIKSLTAKPRQLFNVIDAFDKDETIQIMDFSNYLFGNLLAKRIETADDDEDYAAFADFAGGMTLKVSFEEKSMPGSKPFFSAISIDFKEREDYSEKIAKDAFVLDELLEEKSYKEIKDIFYSGTTSDDEPEDDEVKDKDEEEKSAPKKLSKKVDEEVKKPSKSKYSDDSDEDEEEEKPAPKSVKKPSKKVDEDEESEDGEDEEPEEKPSKKSSVKKPARDEDEDEDEDDEEEAAPPKSKKPSKRDEDADEAPEDESPDEDEDEDEKPAPKSVKKPSKKVDEDEEEEETPKSKKSSKKEDKKCSGKCPHGFAFGTDCYVHSECDDCPEDLREECDNAQEA